MNWSGNAQHLGLFLICLKAAGHPTTNGKTGWGMSLKGEGEHRVNHHSHFGEKDFLHNTFNLKLHAPNSWFSPFFMSKTAMCLHM